MEDSRRMMQQVEQVLHPDTTQDYTQMPKKLKVGLMSRNYALEKLKTYGFQLIIRRE